MTIFQLLGIRSKCCNAPMHYVFGWSWKQDGWHCSKCDKLI